MLYNIPVKDNTMDEQRGMGMQHGLDENDHDTWQGQRGNWCRALCRSGRISEAYRVFDYAVESKSMTDVAAYSTLESTLKSLKKAREQSHAI